MMIRTYDTLSTDERERHARVMSMAQNILAKQHSMVADLDPGAMRKRSGRPGLVAPRCERARHLTTGTTPTSYNARQAVRFVARHEAGRAIRKCSSRRIPRPTMRAS